MRIFEPEVKYLIVPFYSHLWRMTLPGQVSLGEYSRRSALAGTRHVARRVVSPGLGRRENGGVMQTLEIFGSSQIYQSESACRLQNV